MKLYDVTLLEKVSYSMQVLAASPDEAEEIAKAKWENSTKPTEDFNGYGYGVECLHVYLDGKPQPDLIGE